MDESQWADLERSLPAVFTRSEAERLTGGMISAGTLANLDYRGEGPQKFYFGRKAMYDRRGFIAWMRNRVKKNHQSISVRRK